MIVYRIEKEFEAPHQQRVIVEANELGAKLKALDLFISEDPMFRELDQAEQHGLTKQLWIMDLYFSVLAQRIENFK